MGWRRIRYRGRRYNDESLGNNTGSVILNGTYQNSNQQQTDPIDVTDKFEDQINKTYSFFTEKAKEIQKDAENSGLSEAQLYIKKLKFFKDQVGTKMPFDIKQPGKGFSPQEIGLKATYKGKVYNYDDFGNINYGVAAKAFGLGLFTAIAGAGYNQTVQFKSPDLSNPFGFFDHKRDTIMIIIGFYSSPK
jgi:hypothetical protein